MNGRRRLATYLASVGLVGAGVLSVAAHAAAEPPPPPPPGPPVVPGPPPVPPVPGDDALQNPAQLGSLQDIWNDFRAPNLMENLFPMPAAPPTPVRQMPMGPPPPPDPRFAPPQ